MKKLLMVAAAGVGGLVAFLPVGAAHAGGLPPVPAACVVVAGPNGANVQFGSAPNGPSDCQQVAVPAVP